MKRIFLLIAVSICSIAAIAQKGDAKKPTMDGGKMSKNGWSRGLTVYAGMTQTGNNHWYTTGSDKFALAVSGELDAWATKKWKNKQFTSSLSAAYGLFNTTSDGVTKLNDRFEASTRYLVTPKNWKKWSIGPYAALRTQFTNGYVYNYMGDAGVKRRSSGFFAPAFVTVPVLGAEWQPKKWFAFYVSPFTARWTVVTNAAYSYVAQGGIYKGNYENSLASLYNVDPAKEHKGEFGLYANIDFNKEIMKNITLNSRLEVFGNYLNGYKNVLPSSFTNFDMFMTNRLNFKVNKYIKVTYNLDLLYDDDMKQPLNSNVSLPNRSVGLQALSTLGVGFTAKF